MGFWIFMLIMYLLFPVIMIAVGKSFLKAASKDKSDLRLQNNNVNEKSLCS